MTQRIKSLVIVSLGIFGTIAILYYSTSYVILNSFRQLENRVVYQEVQRVLVAVQAEQEYLSSTARDWSNGDDTYLFAGGKNPDFIRSKINPGVFDNLGINILVVIDPTGKILLGQSYEPGQDKLISIPSSLETFLTGSPISVDDQGKGGLIFLPDKTILVAAQPILSGFNQGPSMGFLIMGVYLDSNYIQRLEQTTHTRISTLPFLNSPIQASQNSGTPPISESGITIQTLDENNIAGYAVLNDLQGKPAVFIKIEGQRTIYQQGKLVLGYFGAGLCLIGLAFDLVTQILMIRLVLSQRQRKNVEKEFHQAEAKYRILVEQIPAITYVVTLSEPINVLYISPQITEILGFTPEEWTATPQLWVQQIHPDDLPRYRSEKEMTRVIGRKFQCSYRMVAKDGHIVWIRDESMSLRDADEQLPYLQGILWDITEQKRAEEEISLQAAHAKALVRTAGHLNAHLELQPVLEALCEETAKALSAPLVTVSLFDAARDEFFPNAAGYGVNWQQHNHSRPIPRNIYEKYLFNDGLQGTIEDLQQVEGIPGQLRLQELDAFSMCYTSMIHEGKMIGTLNIFTTDAPRQFNLDELQLLQGLADQAALAITNARLLEDVQRHLKQVSALRTVDQTISSSFDIRVNLNIITQQIISQLNIDAVDILLYNPHTQMLTYSSGSGFRTKALQYTCLRIGESLAGRAAIERTSLRIPNLLEQPEGLIQAPLLPNEDFVSYMAVPLLAKGAVKGVLEVFHRSMLNLDQARLDFLEMLAGQAAIAIDNAELFEGLQRSNIELGMAYEATIEGWSRALDLRDRETEGHTRRVTDLTLKMAIKLGMGQEEQVQIRRGALLHDIGKMGVPDHILLKPGPLTIEEWAIMKKHPVYAFNLLSSIRFLLPARDIPYCHHERWDGSGYPNGLKGEQIPMGARAFSVVDVWDALRSNRPYRPSWPEDKVRHYISQQSGKHFDPLAVETFLQMLEDMKTETAGRRMDISV